MSRYLVIELDDINATPRVFYKGKEITHKVAVNFSWETKTESQRGSLCFSIKHHDLSRDSSVLKTIQEERT